VWLRWALAVAAALYFLGLFVYSTGWKKVPRRSIMKPIAFFLESAGLFPKADVIAFEYRLEGWSCRRRRWERLDPRPYFPMEADNKESRFQRVEWLFRDSDSNSAINAALDDYIARHRDADDGVVGPIGGIRVYEVWRELPPVGEDTARYSFHPLAPLQPGEYRKDIRHKDPDTRVEHRFYFTPRDERVKRCKAEAGAT
jgi:hypothetical protein